MSDLKPKRGFVYRSEWDGFDSCFAPRPQVWQTTSPDRVPVLVVPDPDREPTEAEVEQLALIFQREDAVAGTDSWEVAMACARAAFRLGARVPS